LAFLGFAYQKVDMFGHEHISIHAHRETLPRDFKLAQKYPTALG